MVKKNNTPLIHKVGSKAEFEQIHRKLSANRFVALDVLKPGKVHDISLAMGDPAAKAADAMAGAMGCGAWSNGPLSKVAWALDERDDTVEKVFDKDSKTELGLGYVKWGPNNATPSVIPPLAQSSPYTAAPLRYIADTICGLGPALMYRFPDGTLCDMKDAGYKILEQLEKKRKDRESETPLIGGMADGVEEQAKHRFIGDYVMTDGGIMTIDEARAIDLTPQGTSTMPRNLGPDYWNRLYAEWEKTWYGYDAPDVLGDMEHRMGTKEFLQNNNLNLNMSQCMDDHVKMDMCYPTVGFSDKGLRGKWEPLIDKVDMIPCHSTRLERRNEFNKINHCYVSDSFRTLGIGTARVVSPEQTKIKMFPACMPQHLLQDLRYIVSSNQKSRINARPMWVVCPTFYPSLNKPYYPQPAWWSIFTSKAFDFSATILYDKYKQRENSTTFSRIIYISLDYLEQIFGDEGYQGNPEKQQEFIKELEDSMEDFLQHRENHGKSMVQWMWTGQDGKDHHSVEIVDVNEASNDAVKAGKEELELSTSPIFLALQVDPRLVGVPMVAASNGGTALREMQLLKQQQLNVHQRLYTQFLNAVLAFNKWDCDGRVEFHVKQQTFSTLDRSKTGTVETIAGEGA